MKTHIKTTTTFSLAISLAMVVFFLHPSTVRAATISSLSTNIFSPGSTQLIISGSGFGSADSAGDKVCFNETIVAYAGEPCVDNTSPDLISWADTAITVNVPADPNGYMQAGYLHVYTDYSLVSPEPLYHMQPVITGVDTTVVAFGSAVTVTGKYFRDTFGSAVDFFFTITPNFNGVAGAVDYNTLTKSQMVAYVPHDATSGNTTFDFKLLPDGPTITAAGPAVNVLPPTTNDYYSAMQQYIRQVRANEAWALAGTRKGPIVAVIDEGVYINHPDLRKNIWINPKEKIGNNKDDDQNGYVDDIYGWDFVKGSGEMTVYGTHGTLVAGIIGAVRNNTSGITGIGTNVKIMALRVCDSSGCSTDAIAKAIYYAVDNGATVINLSLGSTGTTGYRTSYNRSIKYAYDHGVIIIAASGNGDLESSLGEDLNVVPQSPVCNDVGKNAVIGVGAVDSNNFLTDWSNFGSKCVDAYAPGVDILSTSVPKYSNLGGFYDNTESGTSFSSPIVTGIVALLRQRFPYMPNSEVVRRVRAAYNSSGVIDAYILLSTAIKQYKPARVTGLDPAFTTTRYLSGSRTITVIGKGFSKSTIINIGTTKATIKFVSSTQLTATFPLSGLSFGKQLVTVTGSNKQRSIFRWYEIKK